MTKVNLDRLTLDIWALSVIWTLSIRHSTFDIQFSLVI
jgi:hypothetical protein